MIRNLIEIWAKHEKQTVTSQTEKQNRKPNLIKYRTNAPFKGASSSHRLCRWSLTITSLSNEITLRKIIVRDPETKEQVVLLTNNLKWSAVTVAGVYKDRWQIEIFFKAIKQNLEIKRFYGNSKNAVMTQVWIALIAHLLFYLLKAKSKIFRMSFTNFISVIKTMLFQRVSIFTFLSGESPPLKPKKLLECQPEFVW
jgi:transposase